MLTINWMEEVEKRKELIVTETQKFLRIDSVLDDSSSKGNEPFGKGIAEALAFLLRKGEEYEFFVKNIDGYAGLIEHGKGKESVGVLCHIDVVPAGEGWTSPPFSADIRDGKIFARGAMDNKGPTMAAFFALAIVRDLGLSLAKRVQLILGTDEESEWRCVEYYFKHEEMPTIGFVPDADFPIIHAEKGITDVTFTWALEEEQARSAVELIFFHAGERFNMVPDQARATLVGNRATLKEIERLFNVYVNKREHKGVAIFKDEQTLHLTYDGISAHGSTPAKGRNAGVFLAHFLHGISLGKQARAFIDFIVTYVMESTGTALGIQVKDEPSGELTVNAGMLRFEQHKEAVVGLNVRYPVSARGEKCLRILKRKAEQYRSTFQVVDHMKPAYVKKDHPLIKTLQAVYERQMNEEASLLSTGGGTYARSLKTGVAFGPLFPGREDVAHQKDEYIIIDDLLKMTALYAEAIYELAKG